jgi:NAD-dependent SIR2 family protein deacetylase
MHDDAIEHAAALLAQADALVIAAGAGLGVDSGLPDFRGSAGFWKAYPALGARGLDFMQVASPRTFETDPRLAWGFYGHRLALYRATRPHAGFDILRRWGEQSPLGAFVFTSNVDGQFQKAGFAPEAVVECHGSIHWLQCSQACGNALWPADALQPDIDEANCHWRGELPVCPRCGGLARPNILMFGDAAWQDRRTLAQEAALDAWLARVRRPVVVELGAGTHVPSVRRFGHAVLHAHAGRLLRINPREAAVPTSADVGLACGALDGLQRIDARLQAAPP